MYPHTRHITLGKHVCMYFLTLHNPFYIYAHLGEQNVLAIRDVKSCSHAEANPESPSHVCCDRAKCWGHEHIRRWIGAASVPRAWTLVRFLLTYSSSLVPTHQRHKDRMVSIPEVTNRSVLLGVIC